MAIIDPTTNAVTPPEPQETPIERVLRLILDLTGTLVFQEIWRIEVSRPEAQSVLIFYVGGEAARVVVGDPESDDDARSKLAPVLRRVTPVSLRSTS